MKKIIMGAAALTVAALTLASPASCQQRWAFEVRSQGSIGTQDVERESSEYGFGYEASLQYRFVEHVSAYAGWDWTRFNAFESIAGPDMDMEETGYAMGLRFEHPFSAGERAAYWVRGGATINHLELENTDGDVVDNSGHGLGWEAGAGVALPLGQNWMMTPGLRYRSLNRDLGIDTKVPVELRYIALEFGLSVRF